MLPLPQVTSVSAVTSVAEANAAIMAGTKLIIITEINFYVGKIVKRKQRVQRNESRSIVNAGAGPAGQGALSRYRQPKTRVCTN